jgi:glycosyltransferase involved in cell wall biosynthesis
MGVVELRTTAGLQSGPLFHASLSVFFPAYNDAKALPSLLATTFETLERLASDYEVIVVNDGSADETAQVLQELSARYSPFLRVVTHPENRGYGAALRSGFAAATKEFVFYTDGDGQYDPAELELLLQAAGPDIGLVNGFKIERQDPLHRVVIGKAYNWLVRRMFGIQVRDVDCDFRLIRRDALDLTALQSTGGTICVELVRSLEESGIKVAEVPVHHFPRLNGRSEFFRIRSLFRTFQQLCG